MQKVALNQGHFKLIFFFSAKLDIVILKVSIGHIYINISNRNNNVQYTGWKG